MEDFVFYNKICLRTALGIEFIIYSNILYCSVQRNKVEVVLVNGTRLKISHSLKELEPHLTKFIFYRCRSNYLINLNHITKYVHKTGELYLIDGTKIIVAKDRRRDFNNIITKRVLPKIKL